MTQDEYDGGYNDPPDYAESSEIHPTDLAMGLRSLPLLGSDLYLRMQAHDVSAVDHFIMSLEEQAQEQELQDDRVAPEHLMLLSALTQMWIFSVYELLRTWRARAKDLIKWSENGGLAKKLATYEKQSNPFHLANDLRAEEIKTVINDPTVVDQLRAALDITHILFTRLEHLRVSLAKHVVARSNDQPALSPGYARLNTWCGSLEYELARGMVTYDVICRRDIADALRSISTAERPTKEELKEFDAFMKGKYDPPFPS